MQLADPPMLSYFLLENPWPLSLSLTAVGLVIAWVARQRANQKLALAALCLVIAALAVQVASTMVETNREVILAETQVFLDSTAPIDVTAFTGHLDDRASVTLPDGDTWLSGDAIGAKLNEAARMATIRRQVILDIEAEMRGENAARSLFDVRTETNLGSFPTRWMLTWVRQPNGPWKVLKIEWLESGRMGAINPDARALQF